MLSRVLLLSLACTLASAELPWPHMYRDTRALPPGDHILLSVSSNVSSSFAALDALHARAMHPLLQQLDAQSVLWDIGAGIGAVSLHAAKRGAHVYAFEWDPILLNDLRASVRANKFDDRVTIVAAFPCARAGSAVMFRRLARAGSFAGIFREHDSTFTQQTSAELLHLERAVADGTLRPPTLIRIDADGQEEIVLHSLRFLFLHPSPPPDVVVEAYAYSLRRVLLYMPAVGYSLRNSVPGLDMSHAPLDQPQQLEFFKQAVFSFFRMQIDTKVFVPYTLHYSASAEAAAASPVNKLCSSSPADDGRAAAAAADDDDVNNDEALGTDTARVDADGVDQPLVVVTAASADFFNNSLNLIGSIHYFEPGTEIKVYDLGLSRDQLARMRCLLNVEVVQPDTSDWPPFAKVLANYAWKMLVFSDAAKRWKHIMWLDAGQELRASIDGVRSALHTSGYFFTIQGCNMNDAPDAACDLREACSVGDKTPPGVTRQLIGVDGVLSPALFESCVAGGIVGVNALTPGGRRALRLVFEPCRLCARRRDCMSPATASAIVNSNFDMACIGLFVNMFNFTIQRARRFNAAFSSALHVTEQLATELDIELYSRRRMTEFLPFLPALVTQDDHGDSSCLNHPVLPHARTTFESRSSSGLLYAQPSSYASPATAVTTTVADEARIQHLVTRVLRRWWSCHLRAASWGTAATPQPSSPPPHTSPRPVSPPKRRTSPASATAAPSPPSAASVSENAPPAPASPSSTSPRKTSESQSTRRGQQAVPPEPSSSSSSSSSTTTTTTSSSSSSSSHDPYLSIILAARNDGHEGSFMSRLQNCLDQIIVLSRRSPQLSLEVIIVEWNPPASSPPLSSALKWPRKSFHVPLRIIKVHAAAAARLDFLHRDPFPQFYAKNIALRRARGHWLLITNADILLGDDLFAFIAQRRLDTGSFYRIDRHDLSHKSAVAGETIRKGGGQDYCIDRIASVMTMTTMGVGGVLIEDLGVSPDRWCSYNVTQWGHLRVRFGDDGSGQMGFACESKSGGPRDYWNTVSEIYERGDGVPVIPFPYDGRPSEMRELHSYADGDFLLLPRDAALSVRGYAEVPLPIFVDSQLSAQVSAFGLKQLVLVPPLAIFHQPHFQDAMAKRVNEAPLNSSQWLKMIDDMLAGQHPHTTNDESWGYAGEDFEEQVM